MNFELRLKFYVIFFSILFSSTAYSKVEVNTNGTIKDDVVAEPQNEQPVGRKSAGKYMGVHPNRSLASAPGDHFLAVHLGTFVNDTAYQWGASPKLTNIGSLTAGVTYRFGEWTNSMDFLFRGDVNSYGLPEGRTVKISLLPMIIFPDAASSFPLYFGAGIGPGIFFSQISQESSVSLDYELVAGVRFFNVLETTGFFLESGIKNHFLLLSDGQFIGVFITAGALFTF